MKNPGPPCGRPGLFRNAPSLTRASGQAIDWSRTERIRCPQRPERPGPRSERQRPERTRGEHPPRSRWHRCSRRSGSRPTRHHLRRRPSRRSSSSRSRPHHPRRRPNRRSASNRSKPGPNHRSSSSRRKPGPNRRSSSSRPRPGPTRRSRCRRPGQQRHRGNHAKPSWRGAWRAGQHASCHGSWQPERQPGQPHTQRRKRGQPRRSAVATLLGVELGEQTAVAGLPAVAAVAGNRTRLTADDGDGDERDDHRNRGTEETLHLRSPKRKNSNASTFRIGRHEPLPIRDGHRTA